MTMRTRAGVPLVLGTLHAWLGHLQVRGWAANPQQTQGPGTTSSFLGVSRLGKMRIVPEAVTGKAQAYLTPKNM